MSFLSNKNQIEIKHKTKNKIKLREAPNHFIFFAFYVFMHKLTSLSLFITNTYTNNQTNIIQKVKTKSAI